MRGIGAVGKRGGFTLLETIIAVAAMAVVFGAMTSTLVTSNVLVQSNQETAIAMDAAASTLAELRATAFATAFATFNRIPDDDPGGVGTAPGAAFDVPGLAPQAGDPDGRVGLVLFPGNGTELREDAVDAAIGMPRDLDGDGAIDALNHAGDYLVLPVRVRVEWTGRGGSREVELVMTLAAL